MTSSSAELDRPTERDVAQRRPRRLGEVRVDGATVDERHVGAEPGAGPRRRLQRGQLRVQGLDAAGWIVDVEVDPVGGTCPAARRRQGDLERRGRGSRLLDQPLGSVDIDDLSWTSVTWASMRPSITGSQRLRMSSTRPATGCGDEEHDGSAGDGHGGTVPRGRWPAAVQSRVKIVSRSRGSLRP